MNRPLRRLALAVALLFGLLLANVNYLQVLQAEDLRTRPGNARQILAEYERERGPILVGDQKVATSVETNDTLKYLRQYPQGRLYAHSTGFYSFVYGATNIERVENPILSGTDDQLFVRRLMDMLTGRPPEGGSVKLTLDPKAQRTARSALGGQNGAVVALDPRTGAILASVSSPSYNPSALSSHDGDAIRSAWERLNNNEDAPLVNRPIAQRYPPGSLFKVVTAAAALSSGKYSPNTEVDAPSALDLPQTTVDLPNYADSACGDHRISVLEALELSCNTAFGNIGLDLGDEALRDQAERFGFNQDYSVPMGVTQSVFPEEVDLPQTAFSAIGQYDVAATPLQMAMVAAGVANDGSVMSPYLVDEVRAPDLSILETARPNELTRAVEPGVAQQLKAMMVSVVDNGTGVNAAIPGVRVGGKTGTAEHNPSKPPHVWFMSFAPAEDPQVAVAVVVEEGGDDGSDASGGTTAAPIAKAVMEAVLNR
ncbi:MAG: peptidoglycan D,D-transpeptidase FtsI family protein [Actinomycetes bacterium]